MAASDVINGLISEVTAGASVEQTPSLESASFTAMISAPQFVNIVDRDPSATGIQTEAHVEMGNRSAEALGRLMFSEAVGMGQAMMLPQYAGRPTTAEFSPEAHEYAPVGWRYARRL